MNAAIRVFCFFAVGYLASYVFRGLNIGFAPFLIHEMDLTAADLGMLTSLYFLGFALAQIPAGAALDTWGPRRVNAVLMLAAALGSAVFAQAESLPALMLGRLLIGAGVAVCMGAGLQALAQHFPAHRVPVLNGAFIAIGGLGGALVGTPLALLLDVATWRAISMAMAVLTVVAAGLIWFGAVDAPVKARPGKRPTVWAQFQGTWELLCSAPFWKLTLFPSISAGMFYAVQSLWMKPYLLDVNQAGQAQTDGLVSMVGLAAVAGSLLSGALARRVERMGMSLTVYCGLCIAFFVVFQVLIVLDAPLPRALMWSCFGIFGACCVLVFAIFVSRYPASVWGRVNTTFNMQVFFMTFAVQVAIGWIVERWEPLAPGVYPAQAHLVAWVCLLTLQVVSAVWYFWPSGSRARAQAEAA
ncbi:nitrate/nitrite transporter [Pusillimonas sp.]|uniref:nitrate/nitrite transporter n=1 Tax=Pusillimonas sp. TaxID=3040095 RepID=UPI0037C88476